MLESSQFGQQMCHIQVPLAVAHNMSTLPGRDRNVEDMPTSILGDVRYAGGGTVGTQKD